MSTEFEPKDKEYIRDLVKRYFKRAEMTQDPMVLTLVGMRIIQDLKKIPFQEMEKALRDFGSNIYLLAWPIEVTINFNEGDIVSLIPTLDKKKEYPYFFYTAFGEEELARAMSELESNYDTNFNNLANTGFPYPRPGTDISRELRSRNN